MLEPADAPEVFLVVHSHDVELFSMADGSHSCEHVFSAAPEPCRSFVLDHLVPASDASIHFGACVDLSSKDASLEFRECALLEGSLVTCVGEIARDRKGELGLHPWRPAFLNDSALGPGDLKRNRLIDAIPRPFSWRHSHPEALKTLIGRVMISDDVGLL